MPFAVANRQEVSIVLSDLLRDAPICFLVQRHDEISISFPVDGEVAHLLGVVVVVVDLDIVVLKELFQRTRCIEPNRVKLPR